MQRSHSKNEQLYQLKKAKEMEAQKQAWGTLAKTSITSSIFHVESKTQFLTLALYLSYAFISPVFGKGSIKQSDEPTCLNKKTCQISTMLNTTDTTSSVSTQRNPTLPPHSNNSANTFFKSASSANGADESLTNKNPSSKHLSPINAVIAKLKTAITHTEQAKIFYMKNKNFSVEINNQLLVQTLRHLLRDKSIFCKLTFALEHGLTFVFGDKTELNENSRHAAALFLAETKRIFIPVLIAIDSTLSLEQVLRHELHHAFVNLQNAAQQRNLKRNNVFSNSPCQPIPNRPSDADTLDCKDIYLIIQKGLKTARHLFDLLDHPSSATQSKLMADYLEACKQYKPHYVYNSVTPDVIEKAKKRGIISDDLTILKKDHLQGTNGIDFFDIEERNGFYWLRGRKYPDNDPRAPLSELLDKVKLYESLDAGTLLIEKDTTIFEVLEDAPMLLDLLFPGLRDYHLKRSEKTYQQCTARGY